jgi:cold shock CspA family protein
MRLQGTITFFRGDRGFGFITTKQGFSYFFHVSKFAKGSQPVLEGEVAFDVAPPVSVGKKPMAVNIRYLSEEGMAQVGAQ